MGICGCSSERHTEVTSRGPITAIGSDILTPVGLNVKKGSIHAFVDDEDCG